MKILVTGTAGFIGFHLANALAKEGHVIVGLDNINDFYDVRLKYDRLSESGILENEIKYNEFAFSKKYTNYKFIKLNLEDNENLQSLFKAEKFEVVCNLAAQAGIRYSIENPYAYIQSNVVGFLNILECCRHNKIKHLIYASSSSVYGNSEKVPFSEDDIVNKPVSLYAATKISNELMAYTYSHLYNFNTTGLRFFTVYGPWGRPDMAPYIFTNAIYNEKPIDLFNLGNLSRDFTFIDDIITMIQKTVMNEPDAKYNIFNMGNSSPVKLAYFVKTIEKTIGKIAQINFKPMQMGDVLITYASTKKFENEYDYKAQTKIDEGIWKFANWYRSYYSQL